MYSTQRPQTKNYKIHFKHLKEKNISKQSELKTDFASICPLVPASSPNVRKHSLDSTLAGFWAGRRVRFFCSAVLNITNSEKIKAIRRRREEKENGGNTGIALVVQIGSRACLPLISLVSRVIARAQRCVRVYPVSGSCVFICSTGCSIQLVQGGDGAGEAGGAGHWLSSSAQTCCGHPVRPFAFFSAAKLSWRPSLCSRRDRREEQRQPGSRTDSLTLRHMTVFCCHFCKRQRLATSEQWTLRLSVHFFPHDKEGNISNQWKLLTFLGNNK